MKKAISLLLPAALLCAAPSAAPAQAAAGDIPHETYRLENGLRVILAPDPLSTAVAVNLWYDVGSRHERPGRSGFGHLFEHLMFEGTERVPRGRFDELLNAAGASLNASITEDRTNYFQTVPPERYNLALWLEADRMQSLLLTEESFRREVEVVKEERRMRIDNAPFGRSQLAAFYYAPYDPATCFPYAHSVIGSMEDLDAATLEDVREFFDTYYAPNNATLAVVGAFDAAEARGLIQQYFGGIRPGTPPPTPACTEPFRHLPVRETIEDGNATLPAVFATYGAVAAEHPDAPALSLLGLILGAGETSRLHQRLVRQEQAALNVSAFANPRRGPGLFAVFAFANAGVEPARLEALLDEEIARLKRDGVTAEELERARNRERAGAVMGRQTVMGRAEALQWHNHFLGDPGAIRTEMARTAAVTADDVRRVANQYLRPDNRAVVTTLPGAEER
jgi:zinc protease